MWPKPLEVQTVEGDQHASYLICQGWEVISVQVLSCGVGKNMTIKTVYVLGKRQASLQEPHNIEIEERLEAIVRKHRNRLVRGVE